MSFNKELAERFEQISQLLELTGADRFRVNAHARASRVIGDYPEDLSKLAEDQNALTKIEGIGKKTAEKIREYAETGSIEELDELLEAVPRGLLDVLEIPGLGPKTVKAMWEEKDVKSVEDLKRIIADGSILELPRMGEKTVQNIKDALAFSEQSGDRLPLGIAKPIADLLVDRLSKVSGVKHAAYAGSLRRGRETIGDVDLLVSASKPEKVREAFLAFEEVEKVLAKGETKSSIRARFDRVLIQADLRLIPEESYGAALMYFTGSKEHNVRLRERALKKDMTLNEYGLFPLDKEKTPPQARGVRPLAAKDEASIYRKLGLPYILPELREDRGEVADGYEPPALIEFDDIKAELHAHTTASDGRMSIVELAERARDRGFHTIAVTDHSQSSAIANGLSPDRLRKHVEAVRAADEQVEGITILAGSEVDILPDGSLDYEDDLLASLDIVVASPHTSLRQEAQKATARLLRAIEHPLVHIIGHPTGRLIGSREGLHPDIQTLAEAAAQHDVALEINANWQRLDLRDLHVSIAVGAGALVAINCDVHRPEGFDQLPYGVITGRRGGLEAASCINTWSARKLHGWLRKKRG